jgi:hypothetical protein
MFELKIGQKVTIECVADGVNANCSACFFDHLESCGNIRCATTDRKSFHYEAKDEDGKVVYLV